LEVVPANATTTEKL